MGGPEHRAADARRGAPGPQAHHLALPPGEARHLAPTAVTVCRHLSTIFVTTPPHIGSLKRLSTSYCSRTHLISQDIFDTAPDRFRVGTQIALSPTSAGYVAPSEVPKPSRRYAPSLTSFSTGECYDHDCAVQTHRPQP